MRINRADLLDALQSVMPGTSGKDVLEQSSCFVFKGGEIVTFNDEICCRIASPLDTVVGAVQAGPLMTLMQKLDEAQLDIRVEKEQLVIRGRQRKIGMRLEPGVKLPDDMIEQPEDWYVLPANFTEALSTTAQSVSDDEDKFVLTCVHMTSEYMQACDGDQLTRYPIQLPMIRRSILVPGDSVKHIVSLAMIEMSVTKSWAHFRNQQGLTLSCRKYQDEYPDLEAFIENSAGDRVVLPVGLGESTKRAEVFSSENLGNNKITIRLNTDSMVIESNGVSGWYSEAKIVDYSGPSLAFTASPKMISQLGSRHNECSVNEHCIKVDTGLFIFVASVGVPSSESVAIESGE